MIILQVTLNSELLYDDDDDDDDDGACTSDAVA